MYFLELLLIALALGTDAFAVTLANGLAFSERTQANGWRCR